MGFCSGIEHHNDEGAQPLDRNACDADSASHMSDIPEIDVSTGSPMAAASVMEAEPEP